MKKLKEFFKLFPLMWKIADKVHLIVYSNHTCEENYHAHASHTGMYRFLSDWMYDRCGLPKGKGRFYWIEAEDCNDNVYILDSNQYDYGGRHALVHTVDDRRVAQEMCDKWNTPLNVFWVDNSGELWGGSYSGDTTNNESK